MTTGRFEDNEAQRFFKAIADAEIDVSRLFIRSCQINEKLMLKKCEFRFQNSQGGFQTITIFLERNDDGTDRIMLNNPDFE